MSMGSAAFFQLCLNLDVGMHGKHRHDADTACWLIPEDLQESGPNAPQEGDGIGPIIR